MSMKNPNRNAGLFAGILAVQMLASQGVALAQPADINKVDPKAGYSNVERSYKSMDKNYARDGQRRAARDITAKIAAGAAQAEVVALLGEPVSRGNKGEWNYNIKMGLVQNHHMVCQYKVFFDGAKRVEKTVWRRPQCESLMRR